MDQTDQLKERIHEVSDTGQDKLQDQATQVKDKLQDQATQVKAKAAEVGNRVASTAAAKTDQALQAASDPEKRKAAQQTAEERIRENPLRAVAAAFAVGFKLGRMTKR